MSNPSKSSLKSLTDIKLYTAYLQAEERGNLVRQKATAAELNRRLKSPTRSLFLRLAWAPHHRFYKAPTTRRRR